MAGCAATAHRQDRGRRVARGVRGQAPRRAARARTRDDRRARGAGRDAPVLATVSIGCVVATLVMLAPFLVRRRRPIGVATIAGVCVLVVFARMSSALWLGLGGLAWGTFVVTTMPIVFPPIIGFGRIEQGELGRVLSAWVAAVGRRALAASLLYVPIALVAWWLGRARGDPAARRSARDVRTGVAAPAPARARDRRIPHGPRGRAASPRPVPGLPQVAARRSTDRARVHLRSPENLHRTAYPRASNRLSSDLKTSAGRCDGAGGARSNRPHRGSCRRLRRAEADVALAAAAVAALCREPQRHHDQQHRENRL